MDVDYGLSDKLFTLTNILRLPINFFGLIFYWILLFDHFIRQGLLF